jgi:hypothetical protein
MAIPISSLADFDEEPGYKDDSKITLPLILPVNAQDAPAAIKVEKSCRIFVVLSHEFEQGLTYW